VIALISQYYENVMNSKVMHQYSMRQTLNQEYFVFEEFFVKIGWSKDEKIDTVILVDGEQESEEGEWQGLTQTMKKIIVEKLDLMQEVTNKEIAKVSDEIKEIREEIVSSNTTINARFDTTNARLDKITTLIESMSKNE
jgi:ribosomal protein L24